MGYGNFGGFGGNNMQNLMRQAQRMQEEMSRKKAELDSTEFRASVGGGMVEVVMTGDKKVKSIKIKPEVVDPDDVEMLEDLVMSGVNDVVSQIDKAERDSMPQMPGMM